MTAKTSPVQEAAAIAWIESELQRHQETGNHGEISPPLPVGAPTLCEFLRDGRALCLLANALVTANALGDEHALPKKLERSMHQLATFHSLERIHFFIRWCRNAVQLEEQHIFTSVQLLDEANADAVTACIDALRQRFRPKFEFDVVATVPSSTLLAPTNEPDDATIVETSSLASANKLNAFLRKFPSDSPEPMPTTTPLPTANTTERPASLTKRFSSSSNSSTTSSTMRDLSSSLISDVDDDEQRTSALSEAPSPRANTISKLKLPLAFTSSANNSPTKEDDVSVKDTRTKQKSVSKLEIPSVFGRQRSLSNAEDTPASVAVGEEAEPPKAAARSVSKLQIPAAFSVGTAATKPEQQAPPSPKTIVVPSSPRSRLEIPSAFAKGSSNTSPSPQTSPRKEAPTPVVEAPPSPTPTPAPTLNLEKKTPSKLTIPSVFGPSTTAAAPVAAVPKRTSKLAAFLSTVEAVNEMTGSSTKLESAAAPVAVVNVEAAPQEVGVPEVESEPELVVAAVEEEIADLQDELAADSETLAPPPQRPSKLLAFLAATEPGTVGVEDVPVPVAEPVVEEETAPVVTVPDVVEPIAAVEEPSVEKEIPPVFSTEDAIETPSPAPPASQRSSKLLAFLAAVPPTAASEAVEETAPVKAADAVVEDQSTPNDDHHDDLSTPLIDVSGEVVHEEGSPRKSRHSRARSCSQSKSPKKQAARELFPDQEQGSSDEKPCLVSEEPTTAPSVSEDEYKSLQEAKDQATAEKEALQEQLQQVEAVAKSQRDTLAALTNELDVLREQLEAQKSEAETAQQAAVKRVEAEAEEETARKDREHKQALETARAKAESERKALDDQLRVSQSLAEERLAELKALRGELETQQRQTQMAKDSEEAARYSAQQAFAARDEAEDKMEELTRALAK